MGIVKTKFPNPHQAHSQNIDEENEAVGVVAKRIADKKGAIKKKIAKMKIK
jgi:hypothetical protein